MESLRLNIKGKIKALTSVNAYADKHKIRRATLVDFLNGRKDVSTRIFFQIIKPLNMGVKEL